MQKFVLRQNIQLFESVLLKDLSEQDRVFYGGKLREAQRELAALEALALGAQRYPTQFGRASSSDRSLFRDFVEGSTGAYLIIDPRPGLHIVDINEAYGAATMTQRGRIAGEKLFDVFPDNPELSDADGVNNLFASLRLAAQTARPHAMAIQRYDIRDASGHFVERYWRPVNTPILNEDQQLVWLLHHVEDVTAEVLVRRRPPLVPLPVGA
jgi:hypothetical protein